MDNADDNILQIHFIVGMSRSGTTWMQESLNRHSQIFAFGETGFFGKHKKEKQYYGMKELQSLHSTMAVSAVSSDAFPDRGGINEVIRDALRVIISEEKQFLPEEVFYRILQEIQKCANKPIIIEKTPHHINCIDEIEGYFPKAKFIIMKREASSFMLSYKHQGDRKPENVRRNFKRMYHPLGCLLIYKKYCRSISRAAKKPNTLLIDNDEIRDSPKAVIENVHSFIGVPYENAYLSENVNTSFPLKKKKLALEDLMWLQLMGYSDQITAKKYDYIAYLPLMVFSLFKLFPWCFFVLLNFKQNVSGTNYLKYLFNYLKK